MDLRNSHESMHIYVFSVDMQAHSTPSANRIRQCAELFLRDASVPQQTFSIPEILYENHKKPCFAVDIGVHFSVSHSGKYWVCALLSEPIGIDIQQKSNTCQQAIAERFFHPQEYRYLQKNNLEGFFDIWTAKESYVKYTGQGIGDGFADFSVINNGRFSKQINDVSIQFVPIDADYSMCVCAKDMAEKSINVHIIPRTGVY
jgi:Phosphopantetheinyl transferase